MTDEMTITPANRVAHGLFKVVTETFAEGVTQQEADWLGNNPAKAAKLFRYQHAMTWFWADLIIKRDGITYPAPDEFMQQFMEASFTQVSGFFSSNNSGKILWALMYDDIDATSAIVTEVAAEKPPYLVMQIGKRWFAKEGIDIDGPQFKMWLTSITASASVSDKVRKVFEEFAR